MNIFDYIIPRRKKASARTAKTRLQIILSQERNERDNPEMIMKIQKDILEVLAKYMEIDKEHVNVDIQRVGDNTVLELNITMPEDSLAESA